MNTLPRRPQLPSPDFDLAGFVSHYRSLLWRWKWFIVLVGPLASAAALALALKLVSLSPDLSAIVTIGLDDASRGSAVADFSAMGNSRIELLKSRVFLKGIVQELSLRVRIQGNPRDGITDSCVIAAGAPDGRFDCSIAEGDSAVCIVYYTNAQQRVRKKEIGSAAVKKNGVLSLPGIALRWSDAFVQAPHSFCFWVVPERMAVDMLLEKMDITMPNRLQDRDYITVALTGSDYRLTAKVLNTIADRFIEGNLDVRSRRTREALSVLQRQLDKADADRLQAELELRAFLRGNPSVGLTAMAQQSMSSLLARQTARTTFENRRAEAQRLAEEFTSSAQADRLQTAQEILVYLSGLGDSRASVLLSDLNRLLTERSSLLQSYSPDHPVVEENRKAIESVQGQAFVALTTFEQKNGQSFDAADGSVRDISQQLNSLPAKERQLAELQRRQQISAQLHADVLTKLNQAKVANVAEVPDAYIIDYAVPPVPPEKWVLVLALAAMACGAGLILGIGPAVAADYVDPTARTAYDLRRRTSLPFVECIPEMRRAARVAPRDEPKGEGAPPLPFAKGYGAEVFGSLRTKMLLSLHGEKNRTIAIVSLSPGDGKSLIAAYLSVAMARQGLKTILVDGDLRRGIQHETFGLALAPGLSECLTNPAQAQGEPLPLAIRQSRVPLLSVMTAGREIARPVEALGSKAMAALHSYLQRTFEVIIYDTPPLGIGADAVVLHEITAKYLAVAMAGRTKVRALERAVGEYPVLRSKLLGIVINKGDCEMQDTYRSYRRYYRRDGR